MDVWDRVRRDGLALLLLLGMTLVVFWRLALTDLIIGRGDIFFYFYPYRDFASAAARAGRVPLWNPFLFMGAPFLANSQAGFFYPLNLALAGLPVARMVNASIVLHAALAAVGAYAWGRGGLELSRPAAWLVGLAYGLGGYFVAQVEHLNQVQALAWLPWLLWLYDACGRWRLPGMAAVVALQFLAGHTQSVFISLVGLGSYAVFPAWWRVIRRSGTWREGLRPLWIVGGVAAWGGALAAVQLLPTLALSRWSMRSGGLPYREAVSFSLRPELLGRALLPGWGASLFPEFVAHVGVIGLGVALLGIWQAGRERRHGVLWLAALGLFLALGGFNPLYFVLVKLVPGFNLFRAPARWLALYALGAAGLAGLGLDALYAGARPPRRVWAAVGGSLIGLIVLVVLGQWLGGDPDPDLAPPLNAGSVVGWGAAVLALGVIWYLMLRRVPSRPRAGALVLAALAGVELLGASTFLPLNRATAPGALTSLRPAVAHLLAAAKEGPPGPPARFLSISDIFFDPGDKPELEGILGPQLSDDALYDYIIATKQKEVLIPNLPLYYRLPAMDGYDGGVLPLRHYVTLERLYMPQENVAIDGRLREHLDAVPAGRWLSLFNVRFVLTDKVGDAWFDGVFYDLQMGAALGPGQEAEVGALPAFPATALGLVYRAAGAAPGTPLAEFHVALDDGRHQVLTLRAAETEVAGEDRVARLAWQEAGTPTAIGVRGLWQEGEVWVRGLSLIDARTGTFQSLVLSDSGRYRLVHSGDVKIYENLDVRPRATFVPQALVVPDDQAALEAMRAPGFDPMTTVVLVGEAEGIESSLGAGQTGASNADVRVSLYAPERVVVEVTAPVDGWVLLSDAWYPGWQARVDDRRVPVERADILFRAVAVPQGTHRVEWVYRPAVWRLGAGVSLVAWGAWLLGLWFARQRSSV